MSEPDKSYSIEALELGPMENFIYLIHDLDSGRVAVVDPAWEAGQIIERVKQQDLRITDILLTHSHFDHINAIEEVMAVYDAQVHLLKDEAKFWGQYRDLPTVHSGGDVVNLGETKINILHTPGHTPGSACYRVGDELIAGDTLFVFGCGRCDLSGGDPNQMFHTLKRLKTELPANTILHPGHNYADKTTSTMQEQIEGNPFMHFDDQAAFVRYRMHEHDKIRHTPYHSVKNER